MPRVLIPLAQGSEELEAVTIIDLLRRAQIEVVVAGLQDGPVRASRGTVLVPDTTLDAVLDEHFDMVVLPGGLPGAEHLDQDPRMREMLQRQNAKGGFTAAICAAPKVLANAGLLDGKSATSYPGVITRETYPKVNVLASPVVTDGKVITSRGPGTAMDFALQLIQSLAGESTRDEVEAALVRARVSSNQIGVLLQDGLANPLARCLNATQPEQMGYSRLSNLARARYVRPCT